jgi:hypothetical protein
MSQFNSIFSPLTNKLARLAGITLLAVAALFASTQQMSAQGPGGSTTCVTSLEVRLGHGCSSTVTSSMVLLGTTTAYDVRINDLNPTNGGIVDGISPASGWVYGVYSGSTLLCSGVIYAVDYTAPEITSTTNGGVTGTTATDTLLCKDISKVLNQPNSWTSSTSNNYFTGRITNRGGTVPLTDSCGGLVQTKVTDRIDYTDCATNNVFATITRTFQAIDQRGNDTTVTQLINFVRPMPRKLAVRTGFTPKTTINNQAVFATNPASGVFTSVNNNYTLSTAAAPNMIIFNKCTGIPTSKEELRPYLKSLYTYTYTIGNLKTDSVSFFDNPCNYSTDFTYTTFDNCNGGKKFMVTTSIVEIGRAHV